MKEEEEEEEDWIEWEWSLGLKGRGNETAIDGFDESLWRNTTVGRVGRGFFREFFWVSFIDPKFF